MLLWLVSKEGSVSNRKHGYRIFRIGQSVSLLLATGTAAGGKVILHLSSFLLALVTSPCFLSL